LSIALSKVFFFEGFRLTLINKHIVRMKKAVKRAAIYSERAKPRLAEKKGPIGARQVSAFKKRIRALTCRAPIGPFFSTNHGLALSL